MTIDIDALVAEVCPPRPNPQLAFTMPVRVVSEANMREHWRKKHNRKKKQQAALQETLINTGAVLLPCTVRLIRIGPRKLDSDNLAGSLKHVQDVIERKLVLEDGDERVNWA